MGDPFVDIILVGIHVHQPLLLKFMPSWIPALSLSLSRSLSLSLPIGNGLGKLPQLKWKTSDGPSVGQRSRFYTVRTSSKKRGMNASLATNVLKDTTVLGMPTVGESVRQVQHLR